MSGQPTAEHRSRHAEFDFLAQVPRGRGLGRVHFLAIGGAGMSGRRAHHARSRDRGHRQRRQGRARPDGPGEPRAPRSGSASTSSTRRGPDAVVMSSSIRDDNVELVAARERGLPVLHRAQASPAHADSGRRVAGANGKTTTTSLLTVALQGAVSTRPSPSAASSAKHGTNAHGGTDDIFVVEADESDGSFLVYRPRSRSSPTSSPTTSTSTATSPWSGGVRRLRRDGPPGRPARDLRRRRRRAVALRSAPAPRGVRVLTYGFDPEADVVLRDHRQDGCSPVGRDHRRRRHRDMRWASRDGTTPSTPRPPMPRADGLGPGPEASSPALRRSTGTRRRFEPKGAGRRHRRRRLRPQRGQGRRRRRARPRRSSGRGRLVVVFQPHLYSRTIDFATELGQARRPPTSCRHGRLRSARGPDARRVRPARRRCRAARAADAEVHYARRGPTWPRRSSRPARPATSC